MATAVGTGELGSTQRYPEVGPAEWPSSRAPVPSPTRAPAPPPTADPTPSQTPVPSPTPSRAPRGHEYPPWDPDPLPPPHSDDPNWVALQQAAFYAYEYPELVGCRPMREPADFGELQTILTEQLDCTQRAWKPLLEELGLPSHTVPHYFHDGREHTTPCGTSSAPARYCSANGGSIYFGSVILDWARYWPAYAKTLTGHEYAHHVQAVSGLWMADRQVIDDGLERTRRTELQAECLAHAALDADPSVAWDRALFDSVDDGLRSGTSYETHGTPEAKVYWGMRGLYITNMGEACNTYVVGPERVR